MDRIQEQVNSLAKALRLQVIEALIKEDRIKYNAPRPTDEEMLYMVGYIDKQIGRASCRERVSRVV